MLPLKDEDLASQESAAPWLMKVIDRSSGDGDTDCAKWQDQRQILVSYAMA